MRRPAPTQPAGQENGVDDVKDGGGKEKANKQTNKQTGSCDTLFVSIAFFFFFNLKCVAQSGSHFCELMLPCSLLVP